MWIVGIEYRKWGWILLCENWRHSWARLAARKRKKKNRDCPAEDCSFRRASTAIAIALYGKRRHWSGEANAAATEDLPNCSTHQVRGRATGKPLARPALLRSSNANATTSLPFPLMLTVAMGNCSCKRQASTTSSSSASRVRAGQKDSDVVVPGWLVLPCSSQSPRSFAPSRAMLFPRARCRARSKGRGCRRTRSAYDHKLRRRKAGVVVCAIWTEVITVRSWRPLQKILIPHHDVRSRARCAVAGQARRAGRRSDNCFGGHEMRAMHARIRRRPPHRKARAEPSACRRSPRRVVVRPSDSWRSLGLLCGRSPFFFSGNSGANSGKLSAGMGMDAVG